MKTIFSVSRSFSLICFLLLVALSQQYMNYNIEDDDLCSLVKKRKIKLGKDSHSGLVVKQYRLNDHGLPWLSSIRCKFELVTPRGEGLIAVIQHLTFRKNATTDECIDYIQFMRKDGSSSPKFCGRFNAAIRMDHNFVNPIGAISLGNSFVDSKGEMDVMIYVSKEPLKADEEMDLSIVFTSYKHCAEAFKKNELYKPCSDDHLEFCIFSGFFYDSYINCPLQDCVDEGSCSKPEFMDKSKPSVGNHVLLGAIGSLFVMFTVFIFALWLCRTFKVVCWADSCARPRTHSNNTLHHTQSPPPPPARVIEMNEQIRPRPPESHQETSASAPNVEEDKDLPPSYDSLFPVR